MSDAEVHAIKDITPTKRVEHLLVIVQIIADQECTNRAATGGDDTDECRYVFPDQMDWCFICWARNDLAAYHAGE